MTKLSAILGIADFKQKLVFKNCSEYHGPLWIFLKNLILNQISNLSFVRQA